MLGQCPICKGMFEIQPSWINQRAQCPYCRQNIVVQAMQDNNAAQPSGYQQPQQHGYQQPPQQGGYPPQQGGYVPQQGGYVPPQQQGGYVPQQSGYQQNYMGQPNVNQYQQTPPYSQQNNERRMIHPSGKSAMTAALLNLLLCGCGQMYLGQVGKGVVILALCILIGLLTMGIGGFVILFIAIIDAGCIGRKLEHGQSVGEWEWF